MSKISKTIELFVSCGLVATLAACSGEAPANSDTASPNDQSTPAPTEVQNNDEESSDAEKANAEFEDKLSGPELLSALQKGGHIIYFRHAKTNKDEKDQPDSKLDLENCEIQRNLSDEGTQQAKDIGATITAKNIPVGEVITSEYCRTWKTADLAFGKHVKNSQLNFLPSKEPTDEQVKEAEAKVKPLLTVVPESGKNTVIVGHSDVLEAATGISPDPEGIAYILTPDGKGNFEVQANVLPEEWSEL